MPGAEHLRDNRILKQMLHQHHTAGRHYGAICAAPAVVLESHGLLQHCQATCHPNFTERLSNPSAAGTRVVVDGNCITSMGPGTALEFALKLVELLFDRTTMEAVAKPMITI